MPNTNKWIWTIHGGRLAYRKCKNGILYDARTHDPINEQTEHKEEKAEK